MKFVIGIIHEILLNRREFHKDRISEYHCIEGRNWLSIGTCHFPLLMYMKLARASPSVTFFSRCDFHESR